MTSVIEPFHFQYGQERNACAAYGNCLWENVKVAIDFNLNGWKQRIFLMLHTTSDVNIVSSNNRQAGYIRSAVLTTWNRLCR